MKKHLKHQIKLLSNMIYNGFYNQCYHRYKLEDVMDISDPKCIYCKKHRSENKLKENHVS